MLPVLRGLETFRPSRQQPLLSAFEQETSVAKYPPGVGFESYVSPQADPLAWDWQVGCGAVGGWDPRPLGALLARHGATSARVWAALESICWVSQGLRCLPEKLEDKAKTEQRGAGSRGFWSPGLGDLSKG